MKPMVLAAIAVLSSLPALAEDLPQRKPGLWESKSVGEQGEVVAKQCIGPGIDQSIVGGMACPRMLVTRTATGYAVETECAMGPIKASGSSVITGDFENALRTEGTTKISGMPGQQGAVERRLVVEAKRIGDCGPGQKPGDVVLPDGKAAPTQPGAPKP